MDRRDGDRRRRRYGLGAFFPTDLPDLGFWLKADKGVTFDGANAVSQWDDQSDSGFDVAQAVGVNQPTYIANSLSGLPGIDFDGFTHFMDRNEANPFVDPTGTVFAVVSGMAVATTMHLWGVSKQPDAAQDEYSYLGIRSGMSIDFVTRTTGTQDILTGSDTTLSGSHVLMMNSDGSTTTAEVDGDSETLVPVIGGNNGNWLGLTPVTTKISLGVLQRLANALFFDGVMHEIIYYGAEKTTAEKLLVTNYLKLKWGI